MQPQTARTLLALTIILIGGLRLIFALSEPTLSLEGYQHLFFTEHIQENLFPLRENPLSYSGREHLYSPIYYYFLAITTYLFDTQLLLKILPNTLYLFIIPLSYLIAYDISKNQGVSVLAALFAGLNTISFSQHIHDASPYALTLPIFLLATYALLKPQKRTGLLLISTTILALSGPSIFLIIFGLIIFLLILLLEHIKISREYLEALFFTSFFGLWSLLVIYKDAFISQGFLALFTFLPNNIFLQEYNTTPLIIAIAAIGVVPVLFGAFASYHTLFIRRNKKSLLLLSIIAATIIAIVTQMMPFNPGLIIIALILCALSAQTLALLNNYFEKTRVSNLKTTVLGLIVVFFVLSSIFPAFVAAADKEHPTQSHQRLVELLPQESVILASTKEGFFFQRHGFATITDTDFVNVPHIIEQHALAEEIYRSRFAISALERTQYLGVTHIVFSRHSREQYGREELLFTPESCFPIFFEDEQLLVYEVRCSVQTR